MPVDVVLFDLDGTLIDSGAGIARASGRALAEVDRPPLTPAQRRAFVGPPLADSFVGIGVPADELDAVVAAYRHHYLADGIFDFEVYPGVTALLETLGTQGLRLGVATSKRTDSAVRVLAHAGLDGHFSVIAGSEPDGSRPTKADVMTGALDGLGVTDPSRVVMVGDREHDAFGARVLATGFIGVSWGFGSLHELTAAGATRIATTPTDLVDLVLAATREPSL